MQIHLSSSLDHLDARDLKGLKCLALDYGYTTMDPLSPHQDFLSQHILCFNPDYGAKVSHITN